MLAEPDNFHKLFGRNTASQAIMLLDVRPSQRHVANYREWRSTYREKKNSRFPNTLRKQGRKPP
jgi:hypothetical protein